GGSGSGSGGGSGGGSGRGSGGGSGSGSGSSSSGGGSGSGSSGGGSSSGSGGGVDASAPVGASVLQFHNHINRDGFFVDSALTAAKAASFARDTTFAGKVTGNVYASPLYVESGAGGKGTFYLATEGGTIFALDETTGAVTWSQNVATPANATGAGCGNIGPIGITGTPAIDLASRLIIFSAASADASKNIATHTIHALSIDDGKEAWKVDVSTLKDPTGVAFSPQPQNQRSAVLIVNGVAYVAYGGHYGDCGTYHGWVVGVPLSGTGAKAWATQVKKGGIWGSGGPSSDGQSVYVTTGNGSDANTTWANSEGLFRLDPGPTFSGAAADYFAPYNWYNLDQGDTDLSGSGPLVIDAPEMTPSKLAMALGKDGYLYLVDRTNLGGIATQSQLAGVGALKVQSGEISNAAAWAHVGSSTYVVLRPNGNNGGAGCPSGSGDLVGVKLDPTAQDKMSVVWCATSNGNGSPSITTTDGNTDPLVWIYGAGGTDHLYALNLTTGAVVGTSTDTGAKVRSFTTPIVVHGRVFVGGDGQLFAFKTK
ncbi:MAG TPA: PQQ-binding-like beta-propeller repeat protein, partial [Polyangiaceae bacterium]